ncbi:MAG: hypothetical protein BWY32_03747 [bacterium ADurb.Bin243]|nr:MAG: hypothetical protein BWY32_03747 [bacterium ADurb.Bin243]
MMRYGHIHIVAAEKYVIAHRHSFEFEIIVAVFNGVNQRKIGSSAADIAYKYYVAVVQFFIPIRLIFINPVIKSGLRLFEQCDVFESGHMGGFNGKLAGAFVERGRDG